MKKRLLSFFLAFCGLFAGYAFALPKEDFELAFPGTEKVVDYEKYGRFVGVGTRKYRYEITDREGLGRAVGEGVYPNQLVFQDPSFQRFLSMYRGKVNPWDYAGTQSAKSDFYAWCLTKDYGEGVKLFFIGEAFRKAGLLWPALKAYGAAAVHFPRDVLWSADGSYYWYVALEAVSRIRKICATYPELGIQLEGAVVDVTKSRQGRPEGDKVVVWPGRFVQARGVLQYAPTFKVTRERGGGRVRLVKYNDRYWELLVNGKPFFIKGVSYNCTKVGESAHALNIPPWMTLDKNKNGKNDGMFDAWVDKNRNNRRDWDEPAAGDAELLKKMGANAIRIYHGVDPQGRYDPKEYDKKLMRRLHRDYGIYFIMGDFLGAYTVGSNARYDIGTDYRDEEHKRNMLAVVRDMVLDHKDEPYVLLWLLGNENQHPATNTNAGAYPEAYARFVNEAAKMIHESDPDHPVAICGLQTVGLKELARFAPEIDIYGANTYSGAYSMGSIWQEVKRIYDRPLLFTEMGCDAYAEAKGADEHAQADYFRLNWKDIELNAAGNPGEGNAIGGVLFEWMDEWWKTLKGDAWGDPFIHNTQGDFRGPFPDSWAHEEWFGIFGQGNGSQSPFLREPRRVYEVIQKCWRGKEAGQR